MNKITRVTPGFDDESAPAPSNGGNPTGAAASTVGQELKAARESRGEDLAAVARTLRIRKDHLQAIEEDRPDDLPGRTYAMGFVRSYADHLGLASGEYVERYKSEITGRSELSPLKGLPPDTGETRLPYGWLVMALIVAGLVGYAGYHLVRSAGLPSIQTVAPVPATMRPQAARSRLAAPASVHVRPSNAGIAAGNAPGMTAGGNPASAGAAAPANPGAQLPPGQVFGGQNRNARVILRARAVTHVLVEGPGGKVFINRVLHPGDTYRVPDLVGLSLTTPDGGAVSVELDGQDTGVAGRTGQMTEALSLDPQAIVDRTHGAKPTEHDQVTP